MLNDTHRPDLRSWLESANQPGCDFPIQNLPFGVFRRDEALEPRIAVAIGDRALDVAGCAASGLLEGLSPSLVEACQAPVLNRLMAQDRDALSGLRARLVDLLRWGRPQLDSELLPGIADVELLLPIEIGDYTDFYASIHHAINVGRMFRPDNPLMPNYKYVPIGYHGRASSIVLSRSGVRRPHGQIRDANAEAPSFAASRLLDYELEVGFFIGVGNELGCTIPVAEAGRHLFGACLVNDWSARDIQSWEYQPLGPFLAKSFATSISPWIVTMEALEPFRVAASRRTEGDPAPLPYLDAPEDQARGGIALTLEVYLQSQRMRERAIEPLRLSRASFENMYWTPAQFVAHHSSNGCNLRTGDLLASGTVSGPGEGERGCLLEITSRGARPIELPGGETRKFLEDGDEVIFRGYCEREGYARAGFGECRGVIG